MRKWILALFFVALLGCATNQPKRDPAASDDNFLDVNSVQLKKVDILGIPFADTVLNEQRTDRNIGVNNLNLQDDFVLRFAHLAEHFAPDLEALGMESCYKARTPGRKDDYREHQSNDKLIKWGSSLRVAGDLWDAHECFTQRVRFKNSVQWRTDRSPERKIEMPRVISLFVPNVLTVDLDTTGTWPFGHRPNDQIGGRFTSLFLKMGDEPGDCSAGVKGFTPVTARKVVGDSAKCHMDSLSLKIDSPYHHWKSEESAFPLRPPKHVYVDASGKRIVGIPEDEFPFLLPPNKGRGYYQTKPDVGME